MTRILDITRADLLAYLAPHRLVDCFVAQTIYIWQHGRKPTTLGRLILEERIRTRATE